MADVVIVKGKTPAADRTWLSFPAGGRCRAAVHVIHYLPHLVVESAFGLDDGLWGTLAADGVHGGPGWPDWPGHAVAKAAADAVVNRWGEGPDTPDAVRDRMRAHSPAAADVADRVDDATIAAAIDAVRRVCRAWRSLPVGGTLRLTWPLATGR